MVEGVRYDELAPLLLSEIQQQQKKLAAQDEKLAAQAQQIGELKQQVSEVQQLKLAMQAALAELEANNSRVAMR
jgi:chromosome segregation ATPase